MSIKVGHKTHVEPELKEKLSTMSCLNKAVVIHFDIYSEVGDYFRIWPTTFLIEKESSAKRKMIASYQTSDFPHWKRIIPFERMNFTLVFESLSRECKEFDIVEIIPQSNELFIPGVKRNKSDIYRLQYI